MIDVVAHVAPKRLQLLVEAQLEVVESDAVDAGAAFVLFDAVPGEEQGLPRVDAGEDAGRCALRRLGIMRSRVSHGIHSQNAARLRRLLRHPV